jgi:hypothetical protein
MLSCQVYDILADLLAAGQVRKFGKGDCALNLAAILCGKQLVV